MTDITSVFVGFAGAVSVVAFALYFIDKALAKAGAFRIPEKVLIFFSVLFGGVGGLAAMLIFRHKTKHWYFFLANSLGIFFTLVVGACVELVSGGII